MPLSGTICQAPFSSEWTAFLISIENFEAVAINLVDTPTEHPIIRVFLYLTIFYEKCLLLDVTFLGG